LGGDISLTSYPDRGTTFTFHIKVNVESIHIDPDVDPDVEECEFTPLHAGPSSQLIS
jgi:hypothetical protein